MGAAMKIVQQRILADGVRADGKVVADMVKPSWLSKSNATAGMRIDAPAAGRFSAHPGR